MTSTSRLGRGATIYDVAARAGVSVATVSRVVRGTAPVAGSTQARVLDAMSALRFVPNRLGVSLAEGRHAANGIVFPDLVGPYFAEVLIGYEAAAGELDRSVIVMSTDGRPAPRDRVLALAARVDGLVVLGRTVDDGVVAEVMARGVPVVTLARTAVSSGPEQAAGVQVSDSVVADNHGRAAELAEHLLAHGVRDVVLLGDPEASMDVAERWTTLTTALAGRATVRPVPAHGFDVAAGVRGLAALLDGGPRDADPADQRLPDIIVAHNDEVALGVLQLARQRGLHVPRDLAVTGWDDVMAAEWAGLTTVRQPMRLLGDRAARLLDARIRGDEAPPQHEVLPTRIVQRRTCGHHEEDR